MFADDLIRTNQTPFLAMSRQQIGRAFRLFSEALPVKQVYYAVKSNPHPEVIGELRRLGACLEIASIYELQLLEDLGVPPEEIVFGNPVKSAAAVARAYRAGVRRFAADSFAELEKIALHAPGSQVILRLLVNDCSSLIPLSKKFGMTCAEAIHALPYARQRGLDPVGLTFHVGSQATSTNLWDSALQACGEVLVSSEKMGIRIPVLDIGGGFPVAYRGSVPEITEIGAAIRRAITEYLPYEMEIIAEPGRYLVAKAGTLVTSVIGRSVRDGEDWLHTDTSAFHGLLETMACQGQLQYPISRYAAQGNESLTRFTLTGPTCDNMDTYATGVELPIDMREDDKLLIEMTGAYTLPFASFFNGFPPPNVVMYGCQDVSVSALPRRLLAFSRAGVPFKQDPVPLTRA